MIFPLKFQRYYNNLYIHNKLNSLDWEKSYGHPKPISMNINEYEIYTIQDM